MPRMSLKTPERTCRVIIGALVGALLGLLAVGPPAHAQSVTVTDVRLGQPGDRWLKDLQFRKIERETRNGQFGYAVTYEIAGHGTVRLFWPRKDINFADKRRRARLRAMKLGEGRLWYPAVITAHSLPKVHRGILKVDAAYKRDARGAIRVGQAFADIASMGSMVPRLRLSLAAGGRTASGRAPAGSSYGASSRPSSSKPPSGGSAPGSSSSGASTSTGTGAAGSAAARTTAKVKASRRALGRALERAGHKKPAGSAAHHIVAGNARSAQKARDILARFGIGINDARNGVFLPATLKSPNPGGALVHSTLHTKLYYAKVNALLRKAKTRAAAERVLQDICESLLDGSFFQ